MADFVLCLFFYTLCVCTYCGNLTVTVFSPTILPLLCGGCFLLLFLSGQYKSVVICKSFITDVLNEGS